MKTIDWKYTSVGQIVADDFAAASVFKKYGIDFCCHGEVMLEKACADLGLAVEEVEQALLRQGEAGNGRISFASWPLDLLMDYILKIHHRGNSCPWTGTVGVAGEGGTSTWGSASGTA